jgi:flagellar assembly factor FliW
MKIQTKYHGEIEISDKEILTFINGIPGFLDEEKFIILPLQEDETFLILQSIVTGGLAFVLVNPFTYFPEYDFSLEESIVELLNIASPEDLVVYSILTIGEPFENTTANLQAPIIINSKNNQAKQVVLNNESYTTRHKILEKR